jgi:hypothetical protein
MASNRRANTGGTGGTHAQTFEFDAYQQTGGQWISGFPAHRNRFPVGCGALSNMSQSTGVGVIKVGAPTEAELKARKDRVEDAMYATRGVVDPTKFVRTALENAASVGGCCSRPTRDDSFTSSQPRAPR